VVYRQKGIEKNVKVAVVVYKLCIAYQYYASPGCSAGWNALNSKAVRWVLGSWVEVLGSECQTRANCHSKLPMQSDVAVNQVQAWLCQA